MRSFWMNPRTGMIGGFRELCKDFYEQEEIKNLEDYSDDFQEVYQYNGLWIEEHYDISRKQWVKRTVFSGRAL